jgi:hypothetical protein
MTSIRASRAGDAASTVAVEVGEADPTGMVPRRGAAPRTSRRGRRRLLAVVLAAAAVAAVPVVVETAAALSVPPPTAAPPATAAAPTTEPAASVAVIGDSLIFQTLTEQNDAISRRGFDPKVYGRPSVPLSDSWVQGYLAATAKDRTVRAVVIATASNDNVEAADRAAMVGQTAAIAEYRARLEATIDQLASRCVVVVNVRSTSAAVYSPKLAASTNAAIADVAAAHAGRVVAVDWDSISRQHRADWFIGDGLHFEDLPSGGERRQAGADAYADAIAAGVSRCVEDA